MHLKVWRQLHCFREVDCPNLVSTFPEEHRDTGKELYIVLTHSCSVSSENFDAEPKGEYIVARPLDGEIDQSKTRRKQRRVLHLSILIDGEPKAYEIKIHERFFFDRTFLQSFPPCSAQVQDPQEFLKWITDRYSLPALPDELEKRLLKFKGKLRSFISKKTKTQTYSFENIHEVLFHYSPEGEAEEGELYELKFLIVVDVGCEADEGAGAVCAWVQEWMLEKAMEFELKLIEDEVGLIGLDNISVDEYEYEWYPFDISGVEGSGL